MQVNGSARVTTPAFSSREDSGILTILRLVHDPIGTWTRRTEPLADSQGCLCGYLTDPSKECTFTAQQIQKYMAKISGPLLDRIDLHIEVPGVKYKELSSKESGEGSERIRARVMQAREVQAQRFKGREGLYANADMQSKDIREYCKLDEAGEELLKMAITKLGLSARAYDRILKVGRTIADMAGSVDIRPEHISEAIENSSLDRNLL